MLLALMTPFSQSEMVPDALLNGSFSSTIGDPLRFFRFSDHMQYKYNTPSNTDTGGGGSTG